MPGLKTTEPFSSLSCLLQSATSPEANLQQRRRQRHVKAASLGALRSNFLLVNPRVPLASVEEVCGTRKPPPTVFISCHWTVNGSYLHTSAALVTRLECSQQSRLLTLSPQQASLIIPAIGYQWRLGIHHAMRDLSFLR